MPSGDTRLRTPGVAIIAESSTRDFFVFDLATDDYCRRQFICPVIDLDSNQGGTADSLDDCREISNADQIDDDPDARSFYFPAGSLSPPSRKPEAVNGALVYCRIVFTGSTACSTS